MNFNPKFTKITTPAGDPAIEITDVPRACWEAPIAGGQTVKDIFIKLQSRIHGVSIAWSAGEDSSMTIDVIERDAIRDEDKAYLNAFLNRFRMKLLAFITSTAREQAEEEPRNSLAMIPLVPTVDEFSGIMDIRRRFEAISSLRRNLGEFLRSRGFRCKFVRVRDTGSKAKATYIDFFAEDLSRAALELENFEVSQGQTFDERYRLKLIKPDHPDNKEGVYLLIVEPKQLRRPS